MNDFDELLNETVEQNQEQMQEEHHEGLGTPLTPPDEEVDNESVETEGASEESTEEQPSTSEEITDPLIAFLNSRGIKDPTKIPFISEDGETEEVDFNSLSSEEKLEILNEIADPGLSEEEINTINYLRKNNTNLQQVIDYFAQQRLEQYLAEHKDAVPQKQYSIDEYTDEDLFIIDLHNRFPDFTDEELLAELNAAKENQESFTKKANAIRTTYKELEDQHNLEQQQREEQAALDLRNNLYEVANNFNEIQLDYTDDKSDSLVVEAEDKQKVISYLMDTDSEGKSAFIKDLENPAALFELGWLRTQGAEALANTAQYWKGQLAEARSINKKLQAELDRYKKKGDNSVVVRPEDHKKENTADYWDSAGLL